MQVILMSRAWDGMVLYGMEGTFWYKRFQGWKGMEDLDDGMKDGLSSFHLISIIQLFTTVYKLC